MFTTFSTNFTGSLETGVDPRTGQFFINLPLAEINGNHLTGPNISLSARYSSLSESNSNGFGKGFSLGGFSFFNRISRRLTLSNGESWPVDTSNNIPDRRLKDCIFSLEAMSNGKEQCRINWKNGVTEYLYPIGENIFATSRMISPIGKELKFTWAWNGTSALLEAIKDVESDLCIFEYNSGGVKMKLWPGTAEECLIIFETQDGHLSSIMRPVSKSERMEWKLNYTSSGPSNKQLLTYLACPTGMTHTVSYLKHGGLPFPTGSDLQWLPAVESYTCNYGGEQASKTSRYTYTSNNFLGRNASTDVFGSWSKQSDYIYSILTNDYTYGSVETISTNNDTVNITRTYNNYHFLISTKTSRNGCVVLKEIQYHAEVGKPSKDQPAEYMLPRKQSLTFEDNKNNRRTEDSITKFDEYGNPTYCKTPDGIVTKFDYYPAEGNEDCPAEPHGFIRFLKQKTIEPRDSIYKDTPAHVTHYTYTNLGNYVVQKTVSEYKSTPELKLLTRRNYTYQDDSNSNKFGRITAIVGIKFENGENSEKFMTRQDFVTSVNDGILIQDVTFKGHDGLKSIFTRRQSAYSGLLYSEISPDKIEMRYSYDLFGRVTRRTSNPETEYENSTTWEYVIVPEGPYSIETNATGNKNKTQFDGAGRVTRRYIFDVDSSKWYEIFSCYHNHLGEVINGAVMDWLSDGMSNFPLMSEISYGGWGEKKTVSYSDGRMVQQQTDPINFTRTVYSQGGVGSNFIRNSSVTTILDKQSQLPVRKELKNITGQLESVCHYRWDGLGQLREEHDELGAITKRTYDEYGRVLIQTLPDGTTVKRTYAPHLTSDHTASISVTGIDASGLSHTWLLGTQTFDSLERLTTSVSGGRTTSYTYEGSSAVPSSVMLSSGKTQTYTYIPALGNAINSITSEGITQHFSYAAKTGELLTASEADSVVRNTWTSDGLLKEETFSCNNQTRRAEYTHSLNGVPITYTDITGKNTKYNMNEHGRVTQIIDDALIVDLSYDALGRLIRQNVRDNSSTSVFTTDLKFDNLGREITRTVTDDKGTKVVLSQIWLKNGQLSTRTTHKNDIKHREEHYEYDNRNRLISFSASGNSLTVDPYGHAMISQAYRYDALNNLTCVKTTFSDHTANTATYIYSNADDPTQLTAINHTHAGYPHSCNLIYNSDGQMIRDESGRTLTYDATGRLTGVNEKNGTAGTYRYDALNRLITQNVGIDDVRELYYRGNELVNEVMSSKNREIRLLKSGRNCMGVTDGINLTLTAGDSHDSLLWSKNTGLAGNEDKLHAWSPYGGGTTDDLLPGFNGERLDPISGTYHLGNGYRAYNPVLMRFNCPDSLSPFGAGSINPYAYCAGDPVNHTDPSGHLSWQAITGIVVGAIGLAAAVFTAGASIAAAGGVMAAIGSASATSLVIGSLGVVSDVTAIVSGALEDSNPEASSVLGWVSLGMGLVGIAAGMRQGVLQALQARKLRNLVSRPDDLDGGFSFFAGNGTKRTPKWYEIQHNGKTIYGADQEVTKSHIRDLLVKKFKTSARNEPKKVTILSATHGTELGYNWASNGRRSELLIEREFYREDKTFIKFIKKNFGRNHQIDVVNSSKMTARNYLHFYDDPTCDVILGFCFSRNDSTLLEHLNLPPVTPYLSSFHNDIQYGHIDLIDLWS